MINNFLMENTNKCASDTNTEKSQIIIKDVENHILVEKSNKTIKNKWTEEENTKLIALIENNGNPINWKNISLHFGNKNARQCYLHYTQINKVYNKGAWSEHEINKLNELIKIHGRKWSKLSHELKTRSGKQIRDRYTCSVSNQVKFSDEEDNQIIDLYSKYGNKFALISKHLPGRTTEEVKNRFYSSIKKRRVNSNSENQNLHNKEVVNVVKPNDHGQINHNVELNFNNFVNNCSSQSNNIINIINNNQKVIQNNNSIINNCQNNQTYQNQKSSGGYQNNQNTNQSTNTNTNFSFNYSSNIQLQTGSNYHTINQNYIQNQNIFQYPKVSNRNNRCNVVNPFSVSSVSSVPSVSVLDKKDLNKKFNIDDEDFNREKINFPVDDNYAKNFDDHVFLHNLDNKVLSGSLEKIRNNKITTNDEIIKINNANNANANANSVLTNSLSTKCYDHLNNNSLDINFNNCNNIFQLALLTNETIRNYSRNSSSINDDFNYDNMDNIYKL